MKHWIIQFNVFLLAPLITIGMAVLKIFPFSEGFKNDYPLIAIGSEVFLIVGSIFIYYFNIWGPYKRYEVTIARKYNAIDDSFKQLKADYPSFNLEYNVMFLRNRLFFRIEPRKVKQGKKRFIEKFVPKKVYEKFFKKEKVAKIKEKRKFTIRGKIFVVAHGENVIPNLRLTENQGICGIALKSATTTSLEYIQGDVVIPTMQPKDFNLNEKQKELCKELTIVISCPLIIKKKNGERQKVIKLGTLNVQSKVTDAASLFATENKAAKSQLFVKIENLGKVFMNLHV